MSNVFVFVTANEYEKVAFELKFKCIKKSYVKGKSYKIGKFGLYDVAYIHVDEQGYTNPAAIPLVGELVREVNPVAVIMVGIAFGVDERRQRIGDVLVSQKILSYDAAKVKPGCTVYKEDVKEPGFQLLNAFRDSDDWAYFIDGKRVAVFKGAILTGSRLINNLGFRNELIADFREYEPIGGEMEAFGIYSVCRMHGVSEWIIIKAICDWAYDKDTNKETYQKIASASAVDYCYHIFSQNALSDLARSKVEKSDQVENAEIKERGEQLNTVNRGHIGKQNVINIIENNGNISLYHKKLSIMSLGL